MAAEQMWDLVANRVYYSVYHAVLALFIHDSIEARTHKGAVVAFGQKYVATGLFDKQWGRLYAKLQELREKCDYNMVYASSEDEMKPILEEAGQMIALIKERLK